jgi:hypothetical protein
LEFIDKPHQESAERGGDQTKNDNPFAPKAIGQRSTREGANETGDKKDSEQDSHLCHANIKLSRDV